MLGNIFLKNESIKDNSNMSVTIVEKVGDVKIYGSGSVGGKGDGLVKINECKIPKAHKLRTRILTTAFYDKYLDQNGKFESNRSVTDWATKTAFLNLKGLEKLTNPQLSDYNNLQKALDILQ